MPHACRHTTLAALLILGLLLVPFVPSTAPAKTYRFDGRTLDTAVWAIDAADGTVQVRDGALVQQASEAKQSVAVRTPVEVSGLRELRVRFTLGEPALMGWGIGLRGEGASRTVAVHKDNMFAWIGDPSHYAGPRWRSGGEYEVRWLFDHDAGHLKIEMVIDGGVPRTRGHLVKYAGPIPEAWNTGPIDLVLGGSARQAGSVRVEQVRLIGVGDAVESDVTASPDIASSFAKWQQLVNGETTGPLQNAIDEAADAASAPRPTPKEFEVQAWDAHKFLSMFGTLDDDRLAELSERYTLLQFRNNLPDTELLERMMRHGLEASVYLRTEQPNLVAALERSPHVQTQVMIKGEPRTRVNQFSGDYLEWSAIQTLNRLTPMVQSGTLRRVLLDSEIKTGIGNDPLTTHALEQLGVPTVMPDHLEDDKFTKVIPAAAPAYRRASFERAHLSPWERHAVIARAVREAWPGLDVTTDPIYLTGRMDQFRGLDVVQHWVRVHWAPRHPRSAAFYTVNARQYLDADEQPRRVMVGPQLGRDTRATPPDMLSTACWLALGFGAHGVTHWGHQAIFTDDGAFTETGAATWERMRRLKQEVYEPFGDLVTRWRPAPRRVAMLVSETDLNYESGRRWYAGYEAAENTYRALLSLGEPVDIVYESDVLAGRLSEYRALIVPQMFVGRDNVVSEVQQFAGRAGVVITHERSVLADTPGIKVLPMDLAPSYQDYKIRRGDPSLLPHEYAAWLGEVSDAVRGHLPFTQRVETGSPDLIANLMTTTDADYLVLVNDRRDYGDEERALGRMMLDRGEPVTTTVRVQGCTAAHRLQPDGNKQSLNPDTQGRFTVTVEPGWGVIIELGRDTP